MKLFLFQLFIVLSLSACASSERPSDPDREGESDLDFNGNDCILIRTIRDYTPLDNKRLLIYGSGNRPYYVELTRPSFEMRSAIGIRTVSRDNQLCPFGGDGLIFGTFDTEVISARSISRLTPDQEEYLLIRHGIKQPERRQAPADPGKVKGADVEELGETEPGFQ